MADEYVVSVVLEGNSSSLQSASDRGARSQDRLKQSTQAANIEFLAQVARYQAMTAALNQTVGGFNKLAGALDRLGFKEQGEQLRQLTAYLELVAGPAEIYLAYLTLSIALGQKDALTKGKQKVATDSLNTSTKALNVTMSRNPLMLVALGVVSVVAMLIILERETGKVTDVIRGLNNELRDLIGLLDRITDVAGGNIFNRLVNSSSLQKLNDMTQLERLGLG
ncbi:MAG TPA: hypothetical protein DCM40_30825 [Maribacter sp.]|nr:hypothetical protein [Maribacter sp.]